MTDAEYRRRLLIRPLTRDNLERLARVEYEAYRYGTIELLFCPSHVNLQWDKEIEMARRRMK